MRLVVSVFLAMLVVPCVHAFEFIDGDDEAPTQRRNMHSCPLGYIVTGVNANNNQFLCSGNFGNWISGETADWGITSTNQFVDATGRAMHWCGRNRFVTGIHVDGNGFNCARFEGQPRGDYTPLLGRVFVDEGANRTVRANMHACPKGSVLVGAHFGDNAFLCAELQFCVSNDQCADGLNCEKNRILGGELSSIVGICRMTGHITLREENNCGGDAVGTFTDRPGTRANLRQVPHIPNDEARSVILNNVRAGAAIQVVDSPSGSRVDDWTIIVVKIKTPANYCVSTFENTFEDQFVRVTYSRHNGLDGKVSRVEID